MVTLAEHGGLISGLAVVGFWAILWIVNSIVEKNAKPSGFLPNDRDDAPYGS